MRRRPWKMTAALILSITLITPNVASGQELQKVREWVPGQTMSTSQAEGIIDDFVGRIQSRDNLDLNPADYEIVADSSGYGVQPRKDSAVALAYRTAGSSAEQRGSSVGDVSFNVAPPTVEQIRKAKEFQASGVQAEPNWFPTFCYARYYVTDNSLGQPFRVGWMDVCHILGWVPPIAGRGNYVFKMWQTCSTEQPGKLFTLTGCGIQNKITTPDAGWTDWNPRSDVPVGTCGTVNYGLSVGPITGSWSFPACDLIKIDKHNPELYMKAWWSGRAWGKNRATEFAFSFTVPETLGASGDPRVSASFSPCSFPGVDPCQDTN